MVVVTCIRAEAPSAAAATLVLSRGCCCQAGRILRDLIESKTIQLKKPFKGSVMCSLFCCIEGQHADDTALRGQLHCMLNEGMYQVIVMAVRPLIEGLTEMTFMFFNA